MSRHQVFNPDGELLREWDDDTQTYTDHESGESRPYTEAEAAEAVERIAEQDARDTASRIQERCEKALAANRAYLARKSPTSAQVAAQVEALTRECSALIRLALARFDSDD